jgi:hypothetical protein
MDNTFDRMFEQFKVAGKDLGEKIKQLIHEGNVRRIIVKDERGHTFMEIPLTIATIGIVAAPILAAVAAIAGMVANFHVIVERNAPPPEPQTTSPVTDASMGATEDQVDMKDTSPREAGKDSLGG